MTEQWRAVEPLKSYLQCSNCNQSAQPLATSTVTSMAVHLDELSEAEIRKAVSTNLGTNFTLRDFKIRPASDNPLGFLGDHIRIKINVEVNGQEKTLHYFAKQIPTKVLSHYEYAQKTGAFYKEIELYKTLFKDFENATSPTRKNIKWLPEFYFSRGSEVFVVEDLSVQDFYMVPERSLVDLEHVRVLIDAVAVMHAASFVFEDKLNKGLVKTYSSKFTPGKKAVIGDLYPNLIFETEANDEKGHPGNTFWEAGFRSQQAVIDLLPDYTPQQRKTIKQNLTEKLRSALQFVKPSNTFKNVLLHGDLWANNVLFRKDESGKVSDAIILDFQLARYGPPAHDLMMSLHLIQTRPFRKEHEAALLNQYYSTLTKHLAAEGVDISTVLPRDEFDASVEYFREYAILNSIMYFQLILTPSSITSKFLSSHELFDKNMYSDRSEMIATCYREDEICRSRMTEAMREAAEYYNWA